MKQAIINKKERIIIIGGINLLPGTNLVESFLIKKHKDMIVDKCDSGCIEMPEMEIEEDFPESELGAYNAADAIKLIKEMNDYDVLMRFQIEEIADKARKTVLAAIEDQIKINKAATTGSDN